MGNVEIPSWLKGLPLAPEFRPTDTEFADPIAYISKIEKEASAFGICKIIPPLPKPSKKYVFTNLNKSLSKCPELGSDVNLSTACSSSKIGCADSGSDGDGRAVFTTRQQELGQSGKKVKGVVNSPQLVPKKQVWQSGEIYTLEQFESKSKAFARSLLGMIKEVSPLVIETLFWKASAEKPIYVEYANDVPGSAFGEPDGQFRHFHRRRRKRMSYRRSGENSDTKKNEMDSVRNNHDNENVGVSTSNEQSGCSEIPKLSTISPSISSDEISQFLRRKNVNANNDMEGTAGWKISNSPWNLQVIARSPGSLTRFMPDDIPGVTSPMVYIGMLFSWFAWHVEDHELHSMNFLHTGSSKTWYAVPGDYAFAFEEVIRTAVYGGSIDRLAALTLLGEKTTLLSPEIIVASGIPCCRLVQNPGEFVVTFPRAYHVGFSHGFNCGEAANFGTPQWLKVAKEAAVRRAAMNYLPMLSHQQLLYLLTMSFVLRVPRSLLPGARSSRLRDRQKEEREFLVKKAFVEDMVNENNKLSALLERESTYHTVLWHPDLLPYPNKDSQSPNIPATATKTPTEDTSHCHDSKNQNNLYHEMSLYMETLNDLYMDEDDLSSDFQIDSGTLACVACGILGFPFMSVIQPSERALKELLPGDHCLVQERLRDSGPKIVHPSSVLHGTVKDSASVDPLAVPDVTLPPNNLPITSKTEPDKEWSTATKFFRPRIFCLEHALQIEELLQSKGGANMLVICHSDYQKMKAHATAVADEICYPFDYHEVPLSSASPQDLNLIDLAIDDEDRDECGQDWTSKLGINLRHCVKVRKNSPSLRVQHALALDGLFSDNSPCSKFLNIKWQFRKSRSKIMLNTPSQSKLYEKVEMRKDEIVAEKLDNNIVKKEVKLIQYSRKKYKSKLDCSTNSGRKHVQHVAQAASSCGDLDELKTKSSAAKLCNIGDTEPEPFPVSIGIPEILHEIQVIDATKDMSLNSSQSQVAVELATTHVVVVDVMGKIEDQTSRMKSEVCHCVTSENEVREISATGGRSNDGNSTSCDDATVRQPSPTSMEESCEGFGRTFDAGNFCNGLSLEDKAPLEFKSTSRSNNDEPDEAQEVRATRLRTPVSMEKCRKDTEESCATEALQELPPQENQILNGSTKEVVSSSATRMEVDQPIPVAIEEFFEVPRGTGAVTSNTTVQEIWNKNEDNVEELVSGSVTQLEENQPINLPGEASWEGTSNRENWSYDVARDNKAQHENVTRNVICAEEPASGDDIVINQPTTTDIPRCSKSQRDICSTEENLCDGSECCLSQDNNELQGIESEKIDSRSNNQKKRKRKSEVEQIREDKLDSNCFIRSPCEGLRPRAGKDSTSMSDVGTAAEERSVTKKVKKPSGFSVRHQDKKKTKGSHRCDLEGCRMSFETKEELRMHKHNRCPYEGCGKKFSSHKYAMLHQRVHDDDRPLKCPWKGCTMSFKWAWARTEHIRVHTGERPYKCKVEGCGLSFRFVSDYSRHRRKTGHYVKSTA